MMLPTLFQEFNYILASQSPRRQYLLKEMGFDFTIEVREVDETVPSCLLKTHVAEHLAKVKAAAFSHLDLKPRTILITADTIVLLKRTILGKPRNREDAVRMLTTLSGKFMKYIQVFVFALPTRNHLLPHELKSVSGS